MKRVTDDDIILFRKLYAQYGQYAAVARLTGWSASTVKRYVSTNCALVEVQSIIRFDPTTLPPPDGAAAMPFEEVDWDKMTQLAENEIAEIRTLWKELDL